MSRARRSFGPVLLLVLTLPILARGQDVALDDLVDAMASRLERSQVHEGQSMGSWSGEEMFTGAIAAGLVCAYEWTDAVTYRVAANWAGYSILRVADLQGNLLGDEAYAFMRLSQIVPETSDGVWRWDVWGEALKDFYFSPRRPGYESTAGYLRYFDGGEPSTTTYFLAHHTVAVYYADDIDKELWREALIEHLSRVDDTASFPVMAVGAATWALTTVGALDETPVASDGSSPYWDGVVVGDLPTLLLGHQVPEGEPFAGSFFWRLDHTAGGAEGVVAGYSEDTIYGALGLVAAALVEEDPGMKQNLEDAIARAHAILVEGVDADGTVYEHLSRQGATHHAYAGEMLQAMWSVKSYGESQETSETTDESDAVVSDETGV